MTMTRMASDRQVDLIKSLVAEREYEEAIDFATLTSPDASSLISKLLKMAKVARPTKVVFRPNLEEGVYRTFEGEIYRVRKSRQSGNSYAKKFDIEAMEFIYSPGAMRFLTEEMKMSLEDVKRFGMETGICCVCGAYLTDEKSVAEGIGPVCAKRFV